MLRALVGAGHRLVFERLDMINKPELLVPAGNLSKLYVAFAYGADAVYAGAPAFGLRQGADNFSFEELAIGVNYAHSLGKRVYVALNAMPHQWELQGLQELLEELETIGPDAFIVSDPGVFRMIKKHTSIACHISTQASVTNKYTSQMWKQMGAKRVIVARELTMHECLAIKDGVDIELEAFVHGSMCTSYSGKCTISNYTAGRDANRGGCVHNCRYQYSIHDQATNDKEYESYIMNSRDLMGISLIPQLLKSRIDSFKIEGRMKSNLYVAQTTRMYRAAIDHCWAQHNVVKICNWMRRGMKIN